MFVAIVDIGELDEDDETKLKIFKRRPPHAQDLAGLGSLRMSYIWAERSSKLILWFASPMPVFSRFLTAPPLPHGKKGPTEDGEAGDQACLPPCTLPGSMNPFSSPILEAGAGLH